MFTQCSSDISRRHFVTVSLIAAMGCGAAAETLTRRILPRSSRQTVNIGDTTHTSGVLALPEKRLPEVEVWLWPGWVGDGVEKMLLARFQKLRIIQTPEALKAAFEGGGFLLRGSGPSRVAAPDIVKWHDATGKPYGITFNAPAAVTAKPQMLMKFQQSISIMSIGNGIPAIVCRWQEQTSKGIRWRYTDLRDRFSNPDEAGGGPGIAPSVLALAKDPAAAKAKAFAAMPFVAQRQRDTMQVLA